VLHHHFGSIRSASKVCYGLTALGNNRNWGNDNQSRGELTWPGKYYPYGPTCHPNGQVVEMLVTCSENGSIKSEILIDRWKSEAKRLCKKILRPCHAYVLMY
jgi:hypothetical protein